MGSGGTNFWVGVLFLGLSDTGLLFGLSCLSSCAISFWSFLISWFIFCVSFSICLISCSIVCFFFGVVIGCAFCVVVDHVDAGEVADGV